VVQGTVSEEHPKPFWQTTKEKEARTNPTRKGIEEVTSDERLQTRRTQRIEHNSLVLLQVNCRSIRNNSLNFWNLTYISDRLCGLVVRVPGYRSRNPGLDSRRYQIF
jgi:hypothetical protein